MAVRLVAIGKRLAGRLVPTGPLPAVPACARWHFYFARLRVGFAARVFTKSLPPDSRHPTRPGDRCSAIVTRGGTPSLSPPPRDGA